jgi:methylglyoxal synthase
LGDVFAFAGSIEKIMETSRHLHIIKRIALVAHDNKKADLIDWAYYNRNLLRKHILVATGTTGKLLEKSWTIVFLNCSAVPWAATSSWGQ